MLFRHNERKKRIEVYKLLPCGEERLVKVKVGVIRLFDEEEVFLPKEGARLTPENLIDIAEYILEE